MRKKQTKEKRPSALGLHDHLPIEGPGRDDLMQLYAWSFEDAMRVQAQWEKEHGAPFDEHIDGLLRGKILQRTGRGPLFRWLGAQELKELYDLYQAGNLQTITEALFVCSQNSLPIPYWCEIAYSAAYRKVRQYKAKSWDDVFERPHPKGTHLGTKRQEREKGISVYMRVKQIKEDDPSVAIDGWLFERVGKEFGIGGKTLTEEYYYKWKNFMEKK